jgi:hypothetical protein
MILTERRRRRPLSARDRSQSLLVGAGARNRRQSGMSLAAKSEAKHRAVARNVRKARRRDWARDKRRRGDVERTFSSRRANGASHRPQGSKSSVSDDGSSSSRRSSTTRRTAKRAPYREATAAAAWLSMSTTEAGHRAPQNRFSSVLSTCAEPMMVRTRLSSEHPASRAVNARRHNGSVSTIVPLAASTRRSGTTRRPGTRAGSKAPQ